MAVNEGHRQSRVVVIGAAAAYTIANADDEMAKRIASEISSNGTQRLGHQLVVGLEDLNNATVETFDEDYKLAQNRIKAAVNKNNVFIPEL